MSTKPMFSFSLFSKKQSPSQVPSACMPPCFIEKQSSLLHSPRIEELLSPSKHRLDLHLHIHQHLTRLLSINKSAHAFCPRTFFCQAYLDAEQQARISQLHIVEHHKCSELFFPDTLIKCAEHQPMQSFNLNFHLLLTTQNLPFITSIQQLSEQCSLFIHPKQAYPERFTAHYFTVYGSELLHTQQSCLRILNTSDYTDSASNPDTICADPMAFLDPRAKTQLL